VRTVKDIQRGSIIFMRGRRFRLIKFERRTTPTGQRRWYAIWLAYCARCGEPFEYAAPYGSLSLPECCDEHRQPYVKRERHRLAFKRRAPQEEPVAG